MLQWSTKFATGHPKIDSQHQALISYINKLEDIPRQTNPLREEIEFILNLVDFIEVYTVSHFAEEESCMACNLCPAYAENKAAHEHFLEFFRKFKKRFSSEGYHPQMLEELHQTCSSWIQSHILAVDMKLKPFVTTPPEESGSI